MSESPDGDERLRKAISWIIVASVSIFALFSLFFLVRAGFKGNSFGNFYFSTLQEHFRVVVGLPMAAVAALFVVLVLRSTSGPIELEVLNLKFKGASGPIIFWLLCFMAITFAIKYLW